MEVTKIAGRVWIGFGWFGTITESELALKLY
jgi:hypothetical protein